MRYEFDDVVVDPDNYRVYKSGTLRPIGPRAFDLLLDLLGNAGRAVDKQELFDRVWKGAAVTDNALTRAVRQVRQVIGDRAQAPRYIETVARRGYRFAASARCVPKSPTVRVAVLPFEDLSPTPDECFTGGLVEELITQLGQANPEHLAVIARASAMSYPTSLKGVAEIGKGLAVDYALEGSVRRAGTRVRVSVQLVRVSDEFVVWSTSYDVEVPDSLRLQESVAEAITRQIQIRLDRSSQAAFAGRCRPGGSRRVPQGTILLEQAYGGRPAASHRGVPGGRHASAENGTGACGARAVSRLFARRSASSSFRR
ncbi:MAG TPA: winged helix-turn-helix domain-containing protein [Vicinamibacterales bacterium]|nr:winged helix-turn-helix domain-containing protein [Vicinamibacterales bacterium]